MWTCPECKCQWPSYGTVEAYKKRKIAREIHGDKQCEEIVNDFAVTGIAPYR